jgi:hypothetical protein
MFRFLFRLLGLLLLAAAFIFVIHDGIKSISVDSLWVTKTSDFWTLIHDGSQQSFQALVEKYAGRDIWRLTVLLILDQPAALMFGVLGIVLTLLGRKKKPLIGYARD